MSQRYVPVPAGADPILEVDAGAGVETVTLTPITPGRRLIVRRKDSSTNTVTITAPAPLTLNGAAGGSVPLAADAELVLEAGDGGYESFSGGGGVTSADLSAAIVAERTTERSRQNVTYGRVTQTAGGNRTVYLGDSTTLGSTDNTNLNLGASYPVYASMISAGRVLLVRNAGVAGNTSAQMLARFDADVTPYAPANVMITAGINDIGLSVAFSTYQANIRALVAACYAIGAKPILGTILPNNTGGRHANISLWNHWLKRYAAANAIPIVDFYAAIVDPANGNYASAYDSGDGTHPNEAGYRVMGTLVNAVVAPILPTACVPLVADQGDTTSTLFSGNVLLTTDTNADGVPDSWVAFGGSSGFAHALVTDAAVPGKMIQVTMTAAASSRIVERSISTGFSVGDTLLFAVVVTSDGGVKVDCKLDFISASKSAYACRVTGAVTRGLAYYEVVVPTGTTQINVDLISGPGTGVVAFGQPTLINLTTKGILTP